MNGRRGSLLIVRSTTTGQHGAVTPHLQDPAMYFGFFQAVQACFSGLFDLIGVSWHGNWKQYFQLHTLISP